MAKHKSKGKKNKRRGRGILLVLMLIIAAALFVGFVLCKTDTITVTGNTILSETELKELLMEPEHTDNSLYFWLYYTYRYGGEIPFMAGADVRLNSFSDLTVEIREEESIGYVNYADSRAYFDRSGTVNELSELVIPGATLVQGLDMQVVDKDKKLPVEDRGLLQSVLTACRELRRLGKPIDYLEVDQKGMLTVYAGTIQIALGLGEHLEDKIALAGVLLDKLEGKTGILHLEDYDGTNGTRSFQEMTDSDEY